MKKLRLLTITVVLVAWLIIAPTAEAFLGFGDIVFDPSVFMQTLMSYFTEISDYANQASQLENQIQQLYNEAQHLAKMDQGSAFKSMSSLTSSLSKLKDLQQNVRGITMDYQKLENAWDKIYAKDFKSFDGKSVKDYIEAADKALKQTNDATYDAMKAQGLVAQIGDDQGNLENLLKASQSADGVLAAAQAGNQIAGVTTQQLMRLQHIVAASYRAQASFYAEQAQKQAMAKAATNKFFSDGVKKPGEGNGRGTKKY